MPSNPLAPYLNLNSPVQNADCRARDGHRRDVREVLPFLGKLLKAVHVFPAFSQGVGNACMQPSFVGE